MELVEPITHAEFDADSCRSCFFFSFMAILYVAVQMFSALTGVIASWPFFIKFLPLTVKHTISCTLQQKNNIIT